MTLVAALCVLSRLCAGCREIASAPRAVVASLCVPSREELDCNGDTEIQVRNVSGGAASHIFNESNENDVFNQTDVFSVVSTGANNDIEGGDPTYIYGTAGDTSQLGLGAVLNNPNNGQFTGDPDCVATLNLVVF